MEKVRRLNPTPKTQRALFLLSQNQCAFPGCTQCMVNDAGHYIGKICHIEAANIGGPRFNPNQTNEDRRQIENLVLMCGTHHDTTDDVQKYTVEVMKKLKADHEKQALIPQNPIIIDRFIDSSLSSTAQFPENFAMLDLTYWDDRSFVEARNFLGKFLTIPTAVRSFYANALLNAYVDDLSLSFDPREVQLRLNMDYQTFMTLIVTLQRAGLLSALDNDDYPHNVRYYFTTDDYDDYQIYFLYSVKEFFLTNSFMLIDFFESLNFTYLDK